MTQRRQRLASFEARSVQLIAACTLGLAGLAGVPPAQATRSAGTTSSPSIPPGGAPQAQVATRVPVSLSPAAAQARR